MPFLNVLISAANTSADDIQRVTSALATATKDILGKDPSVTSIAVQTVAPTAWTIAGHSLVQHAKRAYWVDIKITAATNTKSELARYVSAVHAAMVTELGDVHEESYVLVHEVHASAYGYGGKTQEYRYIAANIKNAA